MGNKNAIELKIFLGEKQMRPKLTSYPSAYFGVKNKILRAFTNGMYEHFDWLEYVVEKDVAVCYPCRRFKVPNSEKGFFGADYTVFAKYGFCNWKKALEKGQGMYKHAASLRHIEAVKLWRESSQREQNDTRISDLLHHDEYHKAWL